MAEQRRNSSRSHAQRRRDPPRAGIGKPYRYDHRAFDTEWVHDKFDDDASTGRSTPHAKKDLDAPEQSEPRGTRIQVENVHYELGPDDLESLFAQVGPVLRLNIQYDRAGRSDGMCFVTYRYREDALEAVRRFDGANALGQPIRLSIPGSVRERNVTQSSARIGHPLAERISFPADMEQLKSEAARDRDDVDRAFQGHIDRYVPGSRIDSPPPRRRQPQHTGRRPGQRPQPRDESVRRLDGTADRRLRNERVKKTQEELDAEMEDYFSGRSGLDADLREDPVDGHRAKSAASDEDVDMIE